MDYLSRIAQGIYSLFSLQYAFVGVPNNLLREDKGESKLANVCFNSGNMEKKRGSTRLHRCSSFVGNIDLRDKPEGMSATKYLIEKGMSEKEAKKWLKHRK